MASNVPRLNIGTSTVVNATIPSCHPNEATESVVLFTFGSIGIVANVALLLLVTLKKPSKRYHQTWSQGLLFHQGLIDLSRSILLVYLGVSVVMCQKLPKCYLADTAFLILVSISTVNMLTMLINDAPIFPEHEQLGSISAAVAGAHRLRSAQSWLDVSTQIEMNEGASTPIAGAGDSPHCIVFAVFIIWFSCLTIHLGPTFLSGGLTTSDGGHLDVCTMIYKPVRHYVLNVLWVLVNMMCAGLMGIHLRKLYRDIVKSNLEATRLASMVTTMIPLRSEADEANQNNLQGYIQKLEEEGSSRVRMYVVILSAYMLFWGPLYVVTLSMPGVRSSLAYEVVAHIAFAHAFINPILFLIMYRSLLKNDNRQCCYYLCFCFYHHPHGSPFGGQRGNNFITPLCRSNGVAGYDCNNTSSNRHRVFNISGGTPTRSLLRGPTCKASAIAPIMNSIMSTNVSSLSPSHLQQQNASTKRGVIPQDTEMTSFDSLSLPPGKGGPLPPPPPLVIKTSNKRSNTRSSSREMILSSSQEYEDDRDLPSSCPPRPHSAHLLFDSQDSSPPVTAYHHHRHHHQPSSRSCLVVNRDDGEHQESSHHNQQLSCLHGTQTLGRKTGVLKRQATSSSSSSTHRSQTQSTSVKMMTTSLIDEERREAQPIHQPLQQQSVSIMTTTVSTPSPDSPPHTCLRHEHSTTTSQSQQPHHHHYHTSREDSCDFNCYFKK